MTDTEILTALKVCTADDGGCRKGCPYYDLGSLSCLKELCKDALAFINRQKAEIEHLQNINKLNEADIADRDEMLKQKVEVVYADFMKDYECIKEENDGLYDENAEQRAEIENLRKQIKLKDHALLSVTYIAKRIPQTICDNTYPDFNKNNKPVNVWDAKAGYTAVDALVEQIVKEATT